MKKYTYLMVLIVLQSGFVIAQTGIGTKRPDESSVLDIDSKGKGLLIPRMSSEQRDLIKNPANALIVYNTTLKAIEVNIGTKLNPNWVLVGNNFAGNMVINNLSSGNIFIGNTSGIAKEVQLSGEASLTDLGVITLATAAVVSKKLVGYKSAIGEITADDSVIQAIQKLDGNQFINTIVFISEDYNILLVDYTILCDTETGSFTLNLPEVSICPGKVYVINKIDETSNELNINPPIQLSKKNKVSKLNYPKSFKIQSDGKVWNVIN